MVTLVKTNRDNVFGWILTRDAGFLNTEFLFLGTHPLAGFDWSLSHTNAHVMCTTEELGSVMKYLEQNPENSNMKVVELIGRTV